MIPLAIPDLTGNEAKYLQECVTSTFVSSEGAFVNRLEEMVAALSGAAYAVATSAGTTGLHAALIAAGVERDDLVILPSFTFIGSANAIAHCGAMPYLLDVNKDTWTLDPESLAKVLSGTDKKNGKVYHRQTGRRIAAVMPVHVLGIAADMDGIVRAAKEHNLPVVADGAAALGTINRGRKIADTGADLTVFSFNGNKTVTAGGGGAICGNDASLVQLARHLTTTARVGADYDHDRIGFNYRMTNLQAAVGCAQLERLSEFVEKKRRIQATYANALTGLSGVLPFPDPAYGKSACWFSGFTLRNGKMESGELRKSLRERGVDARPFWKPIHLQVPFGGCPREELGVTDELWSTLVTLPCSTSLSNADQSTVIKHVQELLG